MSPSLEQRVRREVQDLHEFFVGWFSGRLAETEFERRFLRRFDSQFVLIPPAGGILTLDQLSSAIRGGYASNPDFRIAIREVRLRRVLERHVLATYQEWQRRALASTPPDNGRIATVLFEITTPLRWLHIHETWLPAEVVASAPFDF